MRRHRPAGLSQHPSCVYWQIISVIASSQPATAVLALKARSRPEGDHYSWGSFSIRLYPNEAESNDSNLRSDPSNLFVSCYSNAQGIPLSACITTSFTETYAYPDARIEALSIPPEFDPWIERYVRDHDALERWAGRERYQRREQNHESA